MPSGNGERVMLVDVVTGSGDVDNDGRGDVDNDGKGDVDNDGKGDVDNDGSGELGSDGNGDSGSGDVVATPDSGASGSVVVAGPPGTWMPTDALDDGEVATAPPVLPVGCELPPATPPGPGIVAGSRPVAGACEVAGPELTT